MIVTCESDESVSPVTLIVRPTVSSRPTLDVE
jgi:hypothetical protein